MVVAFCESVQCAGLYYVDVMFANQMTRQVSCLEVAQFGKEQVRSEQFSE